jgi:hypothetical protein
MQTYQESIKHTRKYTIATDVVTTTEPDKDKRDKGKKNNDKGAQNWYSANGTWVGSGYAGYPTTTNYGKTHTETFKEADKKGLIKGWNNPFR